MSQQPIWEGLSDLVRLGFDDRQIRLILALRRYHQAHPEEMRRHGEKGWGHGCQALEAAAASLEAHAA